MFSFLVLGSLVFGLGQAWTVLHFALGFRGAFQEVRYGVVSIVLDTLKLGLVFCFWIGHF